MPSQKKNVCMCECMCVLVFVSMRGRHFFFIIYAYKFFIRSSYWITFLIEKKKRTELRLFINLWKIKQYYQIMFNLHSNKKNLLLGIYNKPFSFEA